MVKIPTFKSKDVATFSKKVGTVDLIYNIIGLISLIGFLILIGIILIFIGMPLYAVTPILIPIFICIIFIIINIAGLIQLSSINLAPKSIEKQNGNNIQFEPNEKVVDSIAGIIRTALGLEFRVFPFPAVGNVSTPENALILTNKRILFIVVPLPGADKNIVGIDIPILEWLTTEKDIEAKLKEMLSSLSLKQIYQSHPKNFSLNLDGIKTIKINKKLYQCIEIVTQSGKIYRYSIRNKEKFNKAKDLFHNFIISD